MPKITRLKDLFDERREVAAWIVLFGAFAGLYTKHLDQWATVALIGLALITLLGASHFRGVKVGPVEVGGKADE